MDLASLNILQSGRYNLPSLWLFYPLALSHLLQMLIRLHWSILFTIRVLKVIKILWDPFKEFWTNSLEKRLKFGIPHWLNCIVCLSCKLCCPHWLTPSPYWVPCSLVNVIAICVKYRLQDVKQLTYFQESQNQPVIGGMHELTGTSPAKLKQT